MEQTNRFIIGDLHGCYNTLLKLLEKLPKDPKLIFVGDLIDRGENSKEIIKFVRKNSHQSTLGNHEFLMIDFSKKLKSSNFSNNLFKHPWIQNGGKHTLFSYGLAKKENDEIVFIKNKQALEEFLDDAKWLESLPLYIETGKLKNNKPIIVSHGSCGDIWEYKDEKKELFEKYALWHRSPPKKDCKIFNIYGHTPNEYISTKEHYINLDSGCSYTNAENLGKLTAYSLDEDKLISVKRV